MTDWAAVIEDDCAVPADQPLVLLVDELVGLLRSPDPLVRDEQACVVLSTWISEGVLDAQLSALGNKMANLLGDAAVQARTSAAAILAEIIARDTNEDLLDAAAIERWLGATEKWWPAEEDVRGYDDELGWLHALAQGADLTASLADSPRVTADSLSRLLDVIAERLLSESTTAPAQNEEDRIAYAVMRILLRDSITTEEFQAWTDRLAETWLEAEEGPSPGSQIAALAVLRALLVQVHLGIRGYGTDDPAQRPTDADTIEDQLLAVLSTVNSFTGAP